jgi:hypothetical protein
MSGFAYNGPAWVELQPGQDFVEADGTVSSYGTVMNWSPQQRTAKGIKAVVDDDIPDGKVQTGSEIVDNAGTPRRVWTLVDAPPPPVPEVISDRQFAQQLAVLGTITEAEAIAWAARGELPEAMEDAVAALPEGEQFPARMLLSSATTYERSHPLVPMLGAILSYDTAELDDLWRDAAVL